MQPEFCCDGRPLSRVKVVPDRRRMAAFPDHRQPCPVIPRRVPVTFPSLGRTPAEKSGHAAAGREPVQLRALIDLGELIQSKRPEESLALYGKGLSTAPTDVRLLG